MFNRGVEEARGVRGWEPEIDNIGMATLPFSSMPRPAAEDEDNEVSSSRYLCRLSELKLIVPGVSISFEQEFTVKYLNVTKGEKVRQSYLQLDELFGLSRCFVILSKSFPSKNCWDQDIPICKVANFL